MNISKLVSFLKTSPIIRDISFLFSGAFLAQGLKIILTPIFSRLYSPEEFGYFGTFSAIVGIFSIIASLRYELAIVLPSNKKDSFTLVKVSLFFSVLTSITLFFITLLFNDLIIKKLLNNSVEYLYLIYIPVTVFMLSFLNIIQNWFTFVKNFKFLSIISILRSFIDSIIKILLGIASFGLLGLLLSQFIGVLVSVILGVYIFLKKDMFLLTKSENIKPMIIKYKNFPLYGMPQGLLSSFSTYLPMLMLTSFYDAKITGYYLFAFTLVSLPVNLVSSSFQKVIYKKISEVKSSGKNTFIIIKNSVFGLFLVGIVPALLIFLYGEKLFSFILGEKWLLSGKYAEILILWLFIGFLSSPAKVSFQVYGKQKIYFYYELSLTIVRIFSFFIGGLYYSEIVTIWLYSIIGAVFNMFLILYMLIYSKYNS